MQHYMDKMVSRFWEYQENYFPNWKPYFEHEKASNSRPPVFLKHMADNNVLMEANIPNDKRNQLLNEIPVYKRHRWFRSMSSSQAIAQSVFGNLKPYDRLSYLNELTDATGDSLFNNAVLKNMNTILEYDVDYLGEPHKTNVDVFIAGDYQVAIECKLTEAEVGTCSRPRLTKKDSDYYRDHCNGTYTRQRNRKKRCSLTEIEVLYWKYIPELFKWESDIDHNPCPLNKNYQLVRNVLSACVRPDGTVSPRNGHVVLIYDEWNPAFQEGGKGLTAYEETRQALREPSLLKKYSWQEIVKLLRNNNDLPWLTEQLHDKYGF